MRLSLSYFRRDSALRPKEYSLHLISFFFFGILFLLDEATTEFGLLTHSAIEENYLVSSVFRYTGVEAGVTLYTIIRILVVSFALFLVHEKSKVPTHNRAVSMLIGGGLLATLLVLLNNLLVIWG